MRGTDNLASTIWHRQSGSCNAIASRQSAIAVCCRQARAGSTRTAPPCGPIGCPREAKRWHRESPALCPVGRANTGRWSGRPSHRRGSSASWRGACPGRSRTSQRELAGSRHQRACVDIQRASTLNCQVRARVWLQAGRRNDFDVREGTAKARLEGRFEALLRHPSAKPTCATASNMSMLWRALQPPATHPLCSKCGLRAHNRQQKVEVRRAEMMVL